MDDLTDPRDVALVAALLVKSIRLSRGGTFEAAAAALGLSEKTLRRWERMKSVPGGENLDLLAEKAGHPPALIRAVIRQLGRVRRAETGGFAGGSSSEPREPADGVVAAAARALQEMEQLLSLEPAPEPWEDTGRPRPEDRHRAGVLWERFTRRDRAQQVRLVRESTAFHTWSFCERLCHESEIAAADAPAAARELAELALFVAGKVPGSTPWRASVESYAHGYLGNALRVGNDVGSSRASFNRSRQLWEAGDPGDPPLLSRARLLDMEASLCREERDFSKALAFLDEALALSHPETKGRILLKKGFTLEQMGDHEQALATLREAEPHVEAHGTLRDLCVLRFNTAVVHCHLGEMGKAAGLLPQIQDLTERLNKTLDRLRLRWLEARVDAGLGRTEEAIARMDRVCEDFLHTDPPLPYDAALAGLDLARYWLQQGDTAAVQRLAVPLGRIFRAKGIDREAAAALRLFCEAARREAVTVEMMRKVEAALGRVGRG